MKFQFKVQKFQTDAVRAISSVFKGQPNKNKALYAHESPNTSGELVLFSNGEIELTDEQLLKNINDVQRGRYLQGDDDGREVRKIERSKELSKPFENNRRYDNSPCNCRCALDVEMETGTGKTYVYTRAMFELNKRYGWSRFIIVVPSIAIREGVYKSLEYTENHFFSDRLSEDEPNGYGKKIQKFIYSSDNLGDIGGFARGNGIHVMIINAQAFNTLKKDSTGKEARIIYDHREELQGRRPIDVIAATRPIVILDEPQHLLTSTAKATRAGLANFNPLFVMTFSATHSEEHNFVYILDALDAYQQKLVKKIEVKGFKTLGLTGDQGFVHLSEILVSSDKPPKARLSFEIKRRSGMVVRDCRIVEEGSDLYVLSNNLEAYRDRYIVKMIDPISNTLTFLNGLKLATSDVVGDTEVGPRMRRVQIRETILSHFQKEEELFKRGIKCLSLFFIDRVINYRDYDKNGTQLLGEYGKIFEEEYAHVLEEKREEVKDKDYLAYIDVDPHTTHDGYFSIDPKTKRYIDSVESRAEGGISKDKTAYEKILKGKEILLSMEEPTRFIFSHSALREGWDNPNVFQICTLKQSDSDQRKRQEVGRGMRLCVDSDGNRMDVGARTQDGAILNEKSVHEMNVLTVIASESYEKFAKSLQQDLEENLYAHPTKASADYFKGKVVKIDGEEYTIDADDASLIYSYLRQNGYADKEGNITDKYRNAQEFAPLWEDISHIGEENVHRLVRGIYSIDEIITRADRPKVEKNNLNENFYKEEFKELWKRINHKYAYTVNFDSRELVRNAVKAINEELDIAKFSYVRTVGIQNDNNLGFSATDKKVVVSEESVASSDTKYDLVGDIAKECKLKRITVCAILGSKDKGLENSEYAGMEGITPEKFALFRRNPVEFMQKVSTIINEQKAQVVVEGIRYDKADEDDPYSNEIFVSTVRFADLLKWEDNLEGKDVKEVLRKLKKKKHVTPYVDIDSKGEKKFVDDLEIAKEVCVYAKLPKDRFVIPTPVGNYSPDWAISFYKGEVKHIYFVAETKAGLSSMDLRPIEKLKISCTKKLFEQVFKSLAGNEVVYNAVDSYEKLMHLVKNP